MSQYKVVDGVLHIGPVVLSHDEETDYATATCNTCEKTLRTMLGREMLYVLRDDAIAHLRSVHETEETAEVTE